MRIASRYPFLIAVALISAAIGDALVETLSNNGIFGLGYHDNDHSSVIPVLVSGTLLTIVILAGRCRAMFRRASRLRRGDWIVDAARCFAERSPSRDIPCVLAMQFAALFAMESVEQISLAGHVSGGTVWLGGPIEVSIAIHSAIGCALTLGLATLVRSLRHTLRALVRDAIDAFVLLTACSTDHVVFNGRDRGSVARVEAPHVRELGGRAPPHAPLAA
jgi:hypothetical protein